MTAGVWQFYPVDVTPAAGEISGFTSGTLVEIHETDSNGTDQSAVLDELVGWGVATVEVGAAAVFVTSSVAAGAGFYALNGLWVVGGPSTPVAGDLVGVTFTEGHPSSSALAEAVYLLAGRFYKSSDAPFGVVGSVDLGGIAQVRSRHPDVEALLFGSRGLGLADAQVWPTVEEIAESILNVAWAALGSAKQAQMVRARAAAIDWVSEHCQGVGVA